MSLQIEGDSSPYSTGPTFTPSPCSSIGFGNGSKGLQKMIRSLILHARREKDHISNTAHMSNISLFRFGSCNRLPTGAGFLKHEVTVVLQHLLLLSLNHHQSST